MRTFATPGDELEYTIVVTNTGNVSLADVHVTDDTADAGSLACDGTLPAALLPDESINCTAVRTVTQSDIDHGEVSNTATANGQDPNGRVVVGQDTVTVDADQSPSMVIDKVAVVDNTIILPADRTDSGDHIGYTITVTNVGNVTLSDVVVTDSAIEDLACEAERAAPGESVVCHGFDTIEQSDIDAGEVSNTAGATAMAPFGDTVEATVTITTPIDQQPDVTVAKSAVATSNGDGSFDFAYTIEVSNPGNATLTDVQIEDDLEAAFGDLEFSVTSLTSDSLTVNSAYNGTTDINLLAGSDRLSPGATARVELVVRRVHTRRCRPVHQHGLRGCRRAHARGSRHQQRADAGRCVIRSVDGCDLADVGRTGRTDHLDTRRGEQRPVRCAGTDHGHQRA